MEDVCYVEVVHAHRGGDPGADQGHAGEMISLGRLGNILVSPLEELVEVAGGNIWISLFTLATRTSGRKRNETKC